MISLMILLLLGLLIPMPVVESFHLDSSSNNNFVRGTRIRQRHQQQHQCSGTSICLSMCICIDCKLVTTCKAYHFVEKKHEQPHMTTTPTFLPREGSPTINVNIRTEQKQIENDDGENGNETDNDDGDDEIIRRQRSMWKDQSQQHDDDDDDDGDAVSSSASASSSVVADTSNKNTAVVVPIVVASSKSKTTIEYDVVKCEDFILDKNCWITNMPDEIKRLNPDFTPS